MKAAVLAALIAAASAAAQTNYPPAPSRPPASAPRPAATAKAVPPAPAAPADPDQLLSQLEQTTAAVKSSLAMLRIEKWKAGSQQKAQLQANAESVRRNITAALPGMVQGVRGAPDNLGASFKLYRNVSALYDVFASLTEAAGAYGSKDDFRDLSQELQQLDTLRHSLGDRVEQLATAKEAELVRLRAQLKPAPAAAQPKKVVVDDNEPPAPKKKKKPAAAAAQSGTSPQP